MSLETTFQSRDRKWNCLTRSSVWFTRNELFNKKWTYNNCLIYLLLWFYFFFFLLNFIVLLRFMFYKYNCLVPCYIYMFVFHYLHDFYFSPFTFFFFHSFFPFILGLYFQKINWLIYSLKKVDTWTCIMWKIIIIVCIFFRSLEFVIVGLLSWSYKPLIFFSISKLFGGCHIVLYNFIMNKSNPKIKPTKYADLFQK